MCVDDDQTSLSAVKPKISYVEAIKYFEESEKEVLNNDCEKIKTNLPEDLHTEVHIVLILTPCLIISDIRITYQN